MKIRKGILGLVAGGAGMALASAGAWAAAPEPWQMGLQPAASPVMERIHDFNLLLGVIITGIALFVFALLGYIFLRFNAKANPIPSKTTHNTVLEVIWTVAPILILVVIVIPSFKLLYFADRTPDAELTLKAIGHQWYWTYEYPDQDDLAFDALMIPDDELKDGQKRLLETDNQVVLPVNTNIRLLITADDVIHSWAVPAFGVKLDGVPGRINETWVRITKEGVYYGQCSELCGIQHGYMPIAVKAVSKEDFATWVTAAKVKFARSGARGAKAQLAATGPSPTAE